jgi:hypothetical protein
VKGIDDSVFLDAVVMKVGRGISSVSFTGVQTAIDSSTEERLAKRVAQRLRAALAPTSS